MLKDDTTLFDPGSPKPDGSTTILDNAEHLSVGDSVAAESSAETRYEKGEMILDTYRIESDAIKGGMGSVWRVHHTGWNVDLAMKRPQSHCFSTEKSKADFIHECVAWIDLGLHPNIVSCYYVREINGTPTIFSEWMDGGSLQQAIKSRALYRGTPMEQQQRILDIAIQFARGLHYAHEAGLIHQDVKPDNLLLTGAGEAKVADFGLARARAVLTVRESAASTQACEDNSKTILSPSGGYTPAYCSMEQMDGKVLTRRTDIYSWAVSVLEMYCGKRDWANGVVAGLNCMEYMQQSRMPVPDELRTLLAACMANVPEERPHDFSEIETKLYDIYRAETGEDYQRPRPTAAADTADSLNNRALSYIDLGKTKEAENLWNQAIMLEPNHTWAVYNQSLHQWRNGEISDADVMSRLDTLQSNDGNAAITELEDQVNQERKPELLIAKKIPKFDFMRACFTADNNALMVDRSDSITIFDTSTGSLEQKNIIAGSEFARICSSRDGTIVAASDARQNCSTIIVLQNADFQSVIQLEIPKLEVEYYPEKYRDDVLHDIGLYTSIDDLWIDSLQSQICAAINYAMKEPKQIGNVVYWDKDDFYDNTYICRWDAKTGAFLSADRYAVHLNPSLKNVFDKNRDQQKAEDRFRLDWIHLLYGENNRCLYTFSGAHSSYGISPDGKYALLVFPSDDQSFEIRVYKIPNGAAVCTFALCQFNPTDITLALEKQLRAKKADFDKAMEQEHISQAITILQEYRNLGGVTNSRDAVDMEKVLAKNCARASLHSLLRENGICSETPAGFPPKPMEPVLPKDIEKWLNRQRLKIDADKVKRRQNGHRSGGSKDILPFGKWCKWLREDGKLVLMLTLCDCRSGGSSHLWEMIEWPSKRVVWTHMENNRLTLCDVNPTGEFAVFLESQRKNNFYFIKLLLKTASEYKPKEIYLGTHCDCVRFSPDNRLLMCRENTGNNEETGTLIVTELRSGVERRLDNAAGKKLYFSQDGSSILAADSIFSSKFNIVCRISFDYRTPAFTDWDEGARPYLEMFLSLHPKWTEEDFNELIRDLQNRGFGAIRCEGVRRKLVEMKRKHQYLPGKRK